MHVGALHTYPVKSLRGVSPDAVDVDPWGPRGDRRWVVLDPDGAPLSASSVPALLGATASVTVDGGLRLSAAGREDLLVAEPRDGPVVAAGVSRLDTLRDAGGPAALWLSALLGRPARLAWLDDPRRRSVSATHGGVPGDVLSLADTGPLLLTSTASLRRLDRWAAQSYAERSAACGARAGDRPAPLDMERFRPNVVVDGDLEPFVEDGWDRVRIGDVGFRVSELCDRCVLTTLDPTTLRRGQEPLRSLAKHRRWDGQVWFGVRLVPLGVGRIRVGDPVAAWADPTAPAVPGRRRPAEYPAPLGR